MNKTLLALLVAAGILAIVFLKKKPTAAPVPYGSTFSTPQSGAKAAAGGAAANKGVDTNALVSSAIQGLKGLLGSKTSSGPSISAGTGGGTSSRGTGNAQTSRTQQSSPAPYSDTSGTYDPGESVSSHDVPFEGYDLGYTPYADTSGIAIPDAPVSSEDIPTDNFDSQDYQDFYSFAD